MSLLTKDQMEQIPALYATENIKNPVVHLEIKCGNATWLITEIDKENELMFGFCEIVKGCGELGYVSLKEKVYSYYTVYNLEQLEQINNKKAS